MWLVVSEPCQQQAQLRLLGFILCWLFHRIKQGFTNRFMEVHGHSLPGRKKSTDASNIFTKQINSRLRRLKLRLKLKSNMNQTWNLQAEPQWTFLQLFHSQPATMRKEAIRKPKLLLQGSSGSSLVRSGGYGPGREKSRAMPLQAWALCLSTAARTIMLF